MSSQTEWLIHGVKLCPIPFILSIFGPIVTNISFRICDIKVKIKQYEGTIDVSE